MMVQSAVLTNERKKCKDRGAKPEVLYLRSNVGA